PHTRLAQWLAETDERPPAISVVDLTLHDPSAIEVAHHQARRRYPEADPSRKLAHRQRPVEREHDGHRQGPGDREPADHRQVTGAERAGCEQRPQRLLIAGAALL